MVNAVDSRQGTTLARWLSAHGLKLILAAFLGLCLVYNVSLPIFEAPDEGSHFYYAHYLATERRFPDLRQMLDESNPERQPFHEITQPALYYLLVALIITPFDRSNVADIQRLNPDWFDSRLNEPTPGKKDYSRVRGQYFHTSAEHFPYQGAVWAVRAGRLLSSALGAATLVLIFLIARALAGEAQHGFALLATALAAFNPKFVHISSIVSNDIAITFAATAACAWMTYLARRTSKLWQFFVLGAIVGVAVLFKLQGLFLSVPALLSVFVLPPRQGVRGWVSRSCMLLVGFLAASGWWLLHNWVNYGHPLAWEQVQQANKALQRKSLLSPLEVVQTLPLWFTSYWGNLGIELHYDGWVNGVLFALLGVAVVGCVVALARRAPVSLNGRGIALLVIWQVVLLLSFGWWLSRYVGTENSRLIMPGIAGVTALTALGWFTLLPKPALGIALSGLIALAVAAPFVTIRPAYAVPELHSKTTLIETYNLPRGERYTTFDGVIELIHAEVGARRVRPGEALSVTLFWGALRPIPERSYAVVLEAVGIDERVLADEWYIPFGGRFSTRHWQPGQYFRDEYTLPIPHDAPDGPVRIQVSLQLLHVDGVGRAS
ncbi:MAG: phospholipid carrier-dependent glycosyltransferase, partial [Anaerolineae bacterium]|nr:phospholipid carrier-dependent glycosyltransferase [Anaerolineae bacterium]